jgi:tetratricopeptide (TPR) repeat protein
MESLSGNTSATVAATPRAGRAAVWVVLSLAAVAAALWVGGRWLGHKPPVPPARSDTPSDPRLSYKGPYRNIHPDVKYVGDKACAGCHKAETDGFHRHPMSRSIVPMSQLAAVQRYDKKAHNPFEAIQSRFTVERRGDKVWQKQERLGPGGKVLAVAEVEAQYAIGSGARGHSYFTTRGGFLFQTFISWYSQKHIWDLSPGFREGGLRPVVSGCVFCHAGGAHPVEDTENRYREPVFTQAAIGCERCHGPGEVHVKARQADAPVKGRIDYTIVNPRHLSPELRENVCQQCHLEGVTRVLRRGRDIFDFRPGLPLQEFWRVYVAAEGLEKEQRAVSQVEQMYRSKCFKASKGKLGCATCHDPHEAPPTAEKRVASHRRKCLNCHEQEHRCSLDQAARLAKSKEDSCIDCHMARLQSDDIAHTATTDHSIPRRPRPRQAPPTPGAGPSALPDRPLLLFHEGGSGEKGDADRDLGLALGKAAREKGGVFRMYLPRARRLLKEAASKYPHDIRLLDGLGTTLDLEGQGAKAQEVFEDILRLKPRHARALRMAARLAQQREQHDTALGYWEKLAVETPFDPEAQLSRALLLARAGKQERALAACGKLLELDPLHGEAYVIRAHCLDKLGKKAEAEAARKKAEELTTPALEAFRARFAQLVE